MKFKLKAKKLWLILPIMVVLSLVAAACGSDGDDDSASTDAAPAEDPTTVGLVYDIGGRGDQSFNDSAFAGFDKARNELNTDGTESSPEQDGSNRAELLELQARQSDLVFAVGFLFSDSVLATAEKFPNTNFAIIDNDLGGAPPANAVGLVFDEDSGSCLVGVAAAEKTATGKIGFIGGVRIPLIEKFERGFKVCANDLANANGDGLEIFTEYITEPPNFDGFNDPAQAKIIAAKMYEEGADVVYHAAGGSGGGLFEAARERSDETGSKVWAIGVDSDQYNTVSTDLREFILTSMLKRVDVAVFNTIQDQVNGEFKGGTVQRFGLSDDGVGYSTSGGFVDDIVDVLEDYKQRAINGEFDFS